LVDEKSEVLKIGASVKNFLEQLSVTLVLLNKDKKVQVSDTTKAQ